MTTSAEDEFKNPLSYISSIFLKAKDYGICRIVPPASFKPPFCFDPGQLFSTRSQKLDQIQVADSLRPNSCVDLQRCVAAEPMWTEREFLLQTALVPRRKRCGGVPRVPLSCDIVIIILPIIIAH